ncbi:MAG: phosphatidylserine/phosphatidylglycerophosphate/cardiolipin synthase family protein [Candidatus Riflebacteria bacterium]|nr:phosphatidylserine/phosphatidylglycerophosphate/cardiolipin synthase family protein [Candidatus Riflebacteria bacterium]
MHPSARQTHSRKAGILASVVLALFWSGLALAGQSDDLATLQREYFDLQVAYQQAVEGRRDAAEIARIADSLQQAWNAYRAGLSRVGGRAPLPEAVPEADLSPETTGATRGTSAPDLAEGRAYDALIARIHESDRAETISRKMAEVRSFLATVRNPYYRMEATFALASLAAEAPAGTAEGVRILQEYASSAPTREAARLALARVEVLRQEAKLAGRRATFSQASQAAGQAWQAYASTSWLALPSKISRGFGYLKANHQRKEAAQALRAELDRYDTLEKETYPRRTLDQLTHSRLVPGNEVTLLVNGRSSFARRFALAEQARERIWLQTLLFFNDAIGNRMADLLIRKAAEGLDVRVIADDAFSFTRRQTIFRKLENGGVRVLINNPLLQHPFKANYRSHQKCFVVDDEEAIVGGMNIAVEYANGEITDWGWRDTDIGVRGPAVTEIADLFERNWERLEIDRRDAKSPPAGQEVASKAEKLPLLPNRDKLIQGPLPRYFEEPPVFGNVRVRFVRTSPISEKDDNVLDLFVSYMKAAKKEVIFETAYFIPTPDLKSAIIAACKRGVKVKIPTNSVESNNHPQAGHAGRANYEDVMKAGAEIYEWQGCQTLHSKVSWFDGFAVTAGAYNVNSRSHALDSEDVLAIEDRRVAATMKKVLDRDLGRARRVTAADLAAWRGDFQTRLQMDLYSLFAWIF